MTEAEDRYRSAGYTVIKGAIIVECVAAVFGVSIFSHEIWTSIEDSTMGVGKTEEITPEGKVIIERTAKRTTSIRATGKKPNPVTGSDIDQYTISQGSENAYLVRALNSSALDEAMKLILDRCGQEQTIFFDIPKQYGDKLVLVEDSKCVEKSREKRINYPDDNPIILPRR